MNIFIICVKIFFARILDVSISTVRQMIMIRGKILISGVLAFLEILIWFMIAREALLISIDSLFIPISYSLGYATGTVLGSFISKFCIKGVVGIQIITDEHTDRLIESLKVRGYSLSLLPMKSGYKGLDRMMIFLEVNQRSMKKIEKLILDNDPNAFFVISDTKKVYNGTVK